MNEDARRRKAECTARKRFAHELLHSLEIVLGCGFAVGAAFTHHIDAKRRVRDLCRKIDVVPATFRRVEIVGKALPIPGKPLSHHDAWNVLDAFHHADEKLAILGMARRKANAAIAHDHGGHAMRRGRCKTIGPDHLAVVVSVDVDKARRDHEPLGVDLIARSSIKPAYCCNAVAGYGDVSFEWRATRT